MADQKEESKEENETKGVKNSLSRSKHSSQLVSLLGEYYQLEEDDPEFNEFISLYGRNGAVDKVWTNDSSQQQLPDTEAVSQQQLPDTEAVDDTEQSKLL